MPDRDQTTAHPPMDSETRIVLLGLSLVALTIIAVMALWIFNI